MKQWWVNVELSIELKMASGIFCSQAYIQWRRKHKKSGYARNQNYLKFYPLNRKICFLLYFCFTIFKSQERHGVPGVPCHGATVLIQDMKK